MNRVGDFLKNFDYKKHLWMLVVGGLFGIYLLLVGLQYAIFYNRVGFFMKVAGVNVGGKSKTQAVEVINSAWLDYSKNEISVADSTKIKPEDWTESVSATKTAEDMLAKQRKGFWGLIVFAPRDTELQVNLKDESVTKAVEAENAKVFVPGQNANIEFTPDPKVIPEKYGKGIDTNKAKETIKSAFGQRKSNIEFSIEEVKPVVFAKDAESLIENAKTAISTDIAVKTNGSTNVISADDLKSWIKLDKTDNQFTFYDKKKVSDWVATLSGKVNTPSVNAQLAIKDGKAAVFVASKDGYELDKAKLEANIQEAATGEKTIEAVAKVTKPDITEEALNNLGIKEQISVGYSDFAGSPTNRIHNVKTGASKFNGVLIKSGEDFSFNKVLGTVDASSGYLEELVIVNNKTEKQFGGGLCQVSSTAFRAALNAGLPILERSPHSYPVVYYKPYGVDASIYLPKPDLVFKNDTGQHILIQTKVVGNRLYFEFYGTKAPRTVKFSGNVDGNGAVNNVENVTPYIYDQEARGRGSFTAVFYRHIYDAAGKLTDNDKFTSKYDTPDNYPH